MISTHANANVRTERGLATYGPAAARLFDLLDDLVKGWAAGVGAEPMLTPPLLPVADLDTFDFYTNFPQLALVAARIDPAQAQAASAGSFPPAALRAAEFGLPSTVCYPVYRHFAGTRLPDDVLVTVLGTCFRNEAEYDGLRRLMAFRMREVVALGSLEHTQRHVAQATDFASSLAAALDLPVTRVVATDPFFDPDGARAAAQRLFPVKHEFTFDGMAVASVNLHRNFFGERCSITRGEPPEPAFTSCVGFGYDRWIHALVTRYDGDWDKVLEVTDRVRADRVGAR